MVSAHAPHDAATRYIRSQFSLFENFFYRVQFRAMALILTLREPTSPPWACDEGETPLSAERPRP
jgi:hypothetical protein